MVEEGGVRVMEGGGREEGDGEEGWEEEAEETEEAN